MAESDGSLNDGKEPQRPDLLQGMQMSLEVLLDACFGFTLSVSCMVFAYVVIVRAQPELAFGAMYGVYMALVIAVVLLAGGLLSERLQTPPGQRFLLIAYIAGTGCTVPMCLIGAYVVAVPCACISLVAGGFIYSEFLNRLYRQSLMTIVDMLVICAGLFLLALTSLEGTALLLSHVAAVVIATVLTTVFVLRGKCLPDFISDEDSKARHIPLQGNRRSLFAIGFMFSSIELGFWLDIGIDAQTKWVALGSIIAAAGIFSLLMKAFDERNYKNLLLKGMAACTAICLLPITFVEGPLKLGFLILFVFASTLEVVVVITAVVESARFNMIAPIWLYGREASVFFIGVAVGTALFSLGGWYSASYPFALQAVICLAVMLMALLQVKVNYQCYPFESVLESGEEDGDIATAQVHTGRVKAIWQQKVQTACDRYKLSPREREVLHYLVRGRDTKYIMDTFYISQSTAKTHIYNIYRKFDVHSRQDLLDFIEEIEVSAEDVE